VLAMALIVQRQIFNPLRAKTGSTVRSSPSVAGREPADAAAN